MLAIKRNIIYTLSITSQAFTLHLPYVLLFRNEDCFYDCLCSSVTVFLFLQLCRLDLGIQLCIYSHKTADEPRFFNWSNASDLWNRRCSHALCHLQCNRLTLVFFCLDLLQPQCLNTLPVSLWKHFFRCVTGITVTKSLIYRDISA